MNPILLFILEAIGTFVAMGILNFFSVMLFEKKFNPITAAIFTFLSNGIIVFILTPYILKTRNPALFYLPILLFFLLFNVLRANRKMKE